MTQRAFPYLLYADAPAAIDFLSNAFGFEPGMRFDVDDGRVGHAELHCQGGTVLLASVWPDMGFASPRDLPAVHAQIKFQVDDVDAHCARARERGATVLSEPEAHGDERVYRAVDLEGHRWIFAGPAN